MRRTGCQEIWAEVCHRFPARFRSSYLILPPDTVSPRDKVTGEFVKGLLNKEAFLLSCSHPGRRLDAGAEASPACKATGVLLPPLPKFSSWGSRATSSPPRWPGPLASRAHSQREEPPLPASPWQQHSGCGSCRAAYKHMPFAEISTFLDNV